MQKTQIDKIFRVDRKIVFKSTLPLAIIMSVLLLLFLNDFKILITLKNKEFWLWILIVWLVKLVIFDFWTNHYERIEFKGNTITSYFNWKSSAEILNFVSVERIKSPRNDYLGFKLLKSNSIYDYYHLYYRNYSPKDLQIVMQEILRINPNIKLKDDFSRQILDGKYESEILLSGKKHKMAERRITTLAGTLLLVWFLFSPILAGYTYSIFNLNFILYLILVYLVVGLLAYYIVNRFGGFFTKEKENTYNLDSHNYSIYNLNKSNTKVGLVYLLTIFAMLFLYRNIFKLVEVSPLLGGIAGLIIFTTICFANWRPSFRKKVNYWLSGYQKDEILAYASTEETFNMLTGMCVTISLLLVVMSGFILFN
jgi:hypothetical protein